MSKRADDHREPATDSAQSLVFESSVLVSHVVIAAISVVGLGGLAAGLFMSIPQAFVGIPVVFLVLVWAILLINFVFLDEPLRAKRIVWDPHTRTLELSGVRLHRKSLSLGEVLTDYSLPITRIASVIVQKGRGDYLTAIRLVVRGEGFIQIGSSIRDVDLLGKLLKEEVEAANR